MLDTPDEVCVEFGVELNAQAGAVLAAASSTASVRVAVTWKSDGGHVPSAGRESSVDLAADR